MSLSYSFPLVLGTFKAYQNGLFNIDNFSLFLVFYLQKDAVVITFHPSAPKVPGIS